jgi:hypothetical protein
MKITSKTDTLDLRNKLKMYAEIVGKDAAEALRRHARLAAVDLSNSTTPFSRGAGGSQKAKGLGEGAVQRDILKVYYPATGSKFRSMATRIARGSIIKKGGKNASAAGEKFKERLLRYQMSDDTAALAKIAADMQFKDFMLDRFDPSKHTRARGRGGKVHNVTPTLVIGAEREMEKYIANTQKKVGLTKAGFALVAQKIPTNNKGNPMSGIPAWVKRHIGRASGRMEDFTQGGLLNRNIRVRMTNSTPWASDTITNSQITHSLQSTRKRFIKYMNAQIRYELKRRAGLE